MHLLAILDVVDYWLIITLLLAVAGIVDELR